MRDRWSGLGLIDDPDVKVSKTKKRHNLINARIQKVVSDSHNISLRLVGVGR